MAEFKCLPLQCSRGSLEGCAAQNHGVVLYNKGEEFKSVLIWEPRRHPSLTGHCLRRSLQCSARALCPWSMVETAAAPPDNFRISKLCITMAPHSNPGSRLKTETLAWNHTRLVWKGSLSLSSLPSLPSSGSSGETLPCCSLPEASQTGLHTKEKYTRPGGWTLSPFHRGNSQATPSLKTF